MIIYTSERTAKTWTLRPNDFLLYFRGCYFVASCAVLGLHKRVYYVTVIDGRVFLAIGTNDNEHWCIDDVPFVIHQHYPETGYINEMHLSKSGTRSAQKAANPDTFRVKNALSDIYVHSGKYHAFIMNHENWTNAAHTFEHKGRKFGYGGVEIGIDRVQRAKNRAKNKAEWLFDDAAQAPKPIPAPEPLVPIAAQVRRRGRRVNPFVHLAEGDQNVAW